jgi:DNA-directed RNA polymerase specialized sigma24 family protein
MVAEPVADQALSKIFVTALLLTGNAKQAEGAVVEVIRRLDFDDASDEALLRSTVDASLERRDVIPQLPPDALERASPALPLELRNVLHLSPELRRCFVLRVLIGLPREVCARLLHLGVGEVDERTCNASLSLAGVL